MLSALEGEIFSLFAAFNAAIAVKLFPFSETYATMLL